MLNKMKTKQLNIVNPIKQLNKTKGEKFIFKMWRSSDCNSKGLLMPR